MNPDHYCSEAEAFDDPEEYSLPTVNYGLYAIAKAAKTGGQIHCPTCNKKFKKKSYQQAFCSNRGRGNCKDRYHNLATDKRRERTLNYL